MTDAEYEKRCAEALRLTRYVRSGSRFSREMLAALDRRGACRSCDSTNYVGLPMLKEDVWFKVMPDGHGNLCLACCEERLGRRLGPEDLQDPSWTEEDFEEAFGAP
jgi:hypothetical protein